MTIALLVVVMAMGAPAEAGQAGSLDLIDQSVDVDPDSAWTARVRISGAGGDAAVVATVFEAVPSRLAFLNSLDSGDHGSAIARLEPVPVDSSGEVVRVVLSAEAREQARMIGPAIHPVVITLRDRDGEILDDLTTHAVLTDEEPPGEPMLTALVLPFGLTPRIAPDGTSELTRRDEQQLGVIVEALSAHARAPISLDVTAETVVALLETGRDGSQGLLAQLAEELVGRELLARPFVRLQPAGWFQSAMTTEFEQQIEAALQVSTATLNSTPNNQVWLGDPTLDETAVQQLTQLGFTQFALAAASAGPEPFRVAGVTENHTAISVDEDLAGHIGSTGDPVLDAHRVLTDLAMIALGSNGEAGGAVVVPPDDWAPSDPFLNALIAGLEDSTTTDPATLGTLFAGASATERSIALEALPPDPLATYPERLDEVASEVAGLASVLPEASSIVAELRTVLLTSGSQDLGPVEREAYLSTVSQTVAQITPTVLTPNGGRVTLTGRDGVIPVALDNQSGRPVRVTVQLRSDKLEFPDGPAFEAELAEGINELEIAVKALTSGDSTLELEVLSPDQSLELSSTSLTVRSTALSGVGLFIAAGALLILLVWWVRNFRSGRRDRRLVGVEAPADQPAGSSGAGAAKGTD